MHLSYIGTIRYSYMIKCLPVLNLLCIVAYEIHFLLLYMCMCVCFNVFLQGAYRYVMNCTICMLGDLDANQPQNTVSSSRLSSLCMDQTMCNVALVGRLQFTSLQNIR